MSNFTTRGLLLLIPGIVLTGYGFVKAVIIGYYPSEAVPTFLAVGVGIALMWAADRFGRNSAAAGATPVKDEAE